MRSRFTSRGREHGFRLRAQRSWIAILLFAVIALAFTANASAAQVTFLSVTGIWHDPTDNLPGVQPGDPVIANGTPTSTVTWGTTSGTPQSSYEFTASLPPPMTLPGAIPLFSLGSFTHRNYAVDDPSLTSVKLDVVLVISVDGVVRPPLTFSFTFNHEETPNNLVPCPYPTPPGEGCTDRVTIVASPQPTTFQIDGVDYTLAMQFLVNGQPTNEYITREGGVTNTSGLVGQFAPPPIPPGTPDVIVTKSGPTTMNPAEWGNFGLDLRNAGTIDAFNVTLIDRLPDGPTGGMCKTTPEILSARVFAADGVTPVAGKGPLVQGTDYSLAYDLAACELTFQALSAASVIGIGERLVIAYRARLDANFQYGTVLTNVAGATRWYNAVASNPGRTAYTRTVTNGTVGIADHEDAHTVTVVPLSYAEKSATLQIDSNSPGIVDAGDVLRYTIKIYNNGQLPITHVVLNDVVPQNTTYVANSMTLNGQPVGQPDGGVSPLIAGVNVSSSNLTPPLPGAGAGVLSPGQSATVQFSLRVNDGVPPGTVISNQAVVHTAERPDLLTDGDGNPATGPEPTVVVVGNLQGLKITKDVSVVGGGAAIAGATLEYVVQVTNVALVPATAVMIRDDIAVPTPGYLSFVDQSWSMNGSTNGITVAGSLLTADYSTNYGALQPGRTITLRFRAVLNPNLAIGTRVTNTATVYWNNPVRQASATVAIDVGGVVGVGILNGRVWHDANFNGVVDSGEHLLNDWSVELYRNGKLTHSVNTDANGVYRIAGIPPNYVTLEPLELRFVAPGANASTAKLGWARSDFTNGLQQITAIVIQPGSNLQNLNLPIEPNGVVYNTISRAPIAGARLTMTQADGGAELAAACFADPAQQNQVTLGAGYYRFDINFSDPSCPDGGRYAVVVEPPPTGYISGVSKIIPPNPSLPGESFSVPTCPMSSEDAITSTTQRCEVQVSEFAPPPVVRPRTPGTKYHIHVTLDDTLVPGSSQVFNNHIPLDPDLQGVIAMTKTSPLVNVTRGQLVPYIITYTNITTVPLFDVSIVDRFPAGFRYIANSARIDGVPVEPTLAGREITWRGRSVDAGARHTITLLLAVGAGVGEGEFINRTQAIYEITGVALSGEASATVRVVPDATFDCTDVIGKVFDDANRNGRQDDGEKGLSGVRLVTVRGLAAITDAFGRFHITCAITPHEGRGSNFVLKLDDRTLPSGYRPSTDAVQVQRATRGKALKFDFGASIHRVVGLDLGGDVFEPDSVEMRPQWKPRLALLLSELRKSTAVLRVSYLADVESPALVDRRMNAVQQEIMAEWQALNCCYALKIEPQVFWRLGAPPKQPVVTSNR